MSSKFCYIIIPMSLEDTYDSIKDYMIKHRGNVVKEQNSIDKSIKTLVVQRGMSFTSNGEQYVINSKYNEYDECTYVAIEINLSSGYGIQWLNPLKLIKQWTSQINYHGVVNLVRKGEIDTFFEFKPKKPKPIELIPKIAPKTEDRDKTEKKPMKPIVSLQEPHPSDKNISFCTNCGVKVNEIQKFCVECGNKIRD